jgi:hypothetical protein
VNNLQVRGTHGLQFGNANVVLKKAADYNYPYVAVSTTVDTTITVAQLEADKGDTFRIGSVAANRTITIPHPTSVRVGQQMLFRTASQATAYVFIQIAGSDAILGEVQSNRFIFRVRDPAPKYTVSGTGYEEYTRFVCDGRNWYVADTTLNGQ